ncbi:MAG: hypothetical protein NVS9B10_08670 [Nevskia sp.]
MLMRLGALSLIGSVIAAASGAYPPAFWLLLNGLALTAGIAWERWRYRLPESTAPGPGWQRSGERIVDPDSGRLTEVWYRPATGERRYIETP